MTDRGEMSAPAWCLATLSVPLIILVLGGGCDNGTSSSPSQPTEQLTYMPREKIIYFSDGYHGGRVFPGTAEGARALKEILALLDEAPAYRVTLELEGALWEDLLSKPQHAELFDRLRARIAEGRIELVGGTYSQPFFYPNDGESVIRQFSIGLEILERAFGFRPVTYATQEPDFATQLPQILNGFDFRFVKLMNRWMAFGSPPAVDEPFFLWRGPDGSKILTSPRYGCQGPVEYWATPVYGSKSLDLFPDRALLEACYRDGIEGPFIVTLEDLLPDNLMPWAGLDLLHHAPTFVRWATPRAYFEEALEPVAGAIAVMPAELTISNDRVVEHPWNGVPEDSLPFPWGVAGGEIQRAARTMERVVLEVERWSALASMFTEYPYPESELDRLWRDTLVAQNHDVWVVLPPVLLDDVAVYRGRNEADRLTREALAALASSVDTRRISTAGTAHPVIVFNPACRTVRGLAEIALPPEISDLAGMRITNDEGELIAFQVLGDAALLIAVDVPALGYRTYYVEETDLAEVAAAPVEIGASAVIEKEIARLESDLYVAEFDLARGGSLIRLFDKDLGLELVSSERPAHVITGHFPERDGWASSEDVGLVQAEVVESGPLRAIIRFDHPGYPLPMRTQATLANGVKRLDITLEVDFGNDVKVGSDASGEESWRTNLGKLSVRVPLPPNNQVLRDAPFHIEATGRESFWANHFAAVTDDDHYAAVLLDRPSALVWSEDMPSLVLAYQGGYLYPPSFLQRKKTYAYALTSGVDVWGSDGPGTRAEEWDFPLRAANTGEHDGQAPSHGSLVEVSGDIAIPAVFLAGDQPRLRLFNPSPQPREATVRLSAGPGLTRLFDLRGTDIGQARMPLQLPAFGLMTLGAPGGSSPSDTAEMPAAPPAQARELTATAEPLRARFYLKPDFLLGSREPPIPRPWKEAMTPGSERTFVAAPARASLALTGPARATLFIARGSSPVDTVQLRAEILRSDREPPIAEGSAIVELTQCKFRWESYLEPLCALPVAITFPIEPGTRLEAGERLALRVSLDADAAGQVAQLLYDSTHFPSQLELAAEGLLSVVAARSVTEGEDGGEGRTRIEVEVEDLLGSADVLDAAAILESSSRRSSERLSIPLSFERDLTPTRSLWTGEQNSSLPVSDMDATVIVRNLARTTTVRRHALGEQ